MRECKYRLPCNWCDKYNRMCEAILIEINKQQFENKKEEENIGKPNLKECEHEWRYEGQLGNKHHYRCIKCDTLKAVPLSNLGNI